MIPKNLNYGNKVESASCKSYRSNIVPQNGTGNYGLNDVITINIPTRANLVMASTDSYLKFKMIFTSSGADVSARWDSCGAHGLIQRIRIFHGSNLIEDIDNYGLLAKMLYDIQMPTDATYGKFNITSGTRSDLVAQLPNITAGSTYSQTDMQKLDNALVSCVQTNSGDLIASNVASNTEIELIYCLNLISLVGSLCPNFYLPLFGMTSSPLRVEIQLVDNIYKAMAVQNNSCTVQLKEVEFIASLIELGDSAMSIVAGNLQGKPLQFVFTDYRNYGNSYSLTQNSDTQIAFPIAAKFSSLKSLFIAPRDKGLGAATYFPLSSTTNGITSYYFRVGAQTLPPKFPNTTTEMFCELMKAIGSISDVLYTPSIEKVSYNISSSSALTVSSDPNYNASSSGSFFIGLDLENYTNASKDAIFAGYNTNTDDIFFIGNFEASSNRTVRFDAYAMFDALLVVENGTAYVRY
jgi:hypothetical protein